MCNIPQNPQDVTVKRSVIQLLETIGQIEATFLFL